MSPRQPPTKTFRLATLSSVPTQSRSHLAGLRGILGQVFFRTTQSTNAGSNLSAAAPMQLMLPDGDLKWTSFRGGCRGVERERQGDDGGEHARMLRA